MDMGPLVPALSKLADYAASGIGSIAGTVLATWRADRLASARRIATRGEADSLGILAEGQSNAIKIIAEAQAEARQMLVSPESTIRGEIEFSDTVNQRIQFQEEKRQHNIEDVLTKAALELGNEDVQEHEPDHDWTSRFFNDIQDVSNEEAQQLYAKVLVLQRQFREGCGVMPAWRRGAWHGSVWPVRYCPAYPQATAATQLARTVPGAAFPAPPGRPAAS